MAGLRQPIITARKRSLRRLCFHRCLSVHRGGGTVPAQVLPPGPHLAGTPPGRYSPRQTQPPGRDTPTPQQVHPRQVHPSWQVHPKAGTPLAGTPPNRYIPLGSSPPRQVHLPTTVHAGIWSTSGRYASHWNAFLMSNIFSKKTA